MGDDHGHSTEPTRRRKQEQEDASEEITEVARGILRLQLPTDFTGLGHVNTYAIEDSRGFTLVDPGLPSDESWVALQQRLAAAGIPLNRVHTTFITHSHPDHFGGAHKLVEEAGTEVLTSTMFRRWTDLLDLDETPLEPMDPADASEGATMLDAVAHADEEEMERDYPGFKAFRDRVRAAVADGRIEEVSWMKAPRPTIVVDDAQTVRMGDRDWVAVFTPGHTHDHLCMWSPEDGVLLSGDHVLPTITPHIAGAGPGGGLLYDDPLAEFFKSLQRMHDFDVRLVLPAHGHPFHDLSGRADHIIEHHGERLDLLRNAIDEIPTGSVADYMRLMFKERSWGDMAESETFAHLEHLRQLGEATVEEHDGSLVYDLASSAK
jgi:glyoxylase-like metal-dependent hydrolase (beta-lactamase superfamily II)